MKDRSPVAGVPTGRATHAATLDEVRSMLAEAGFENIRIDVNESSREVINNWLPGTGLDGYVVSAMIEAIRP